MRLLTFWMAKRHSLSIWDHVDALGRVISVKMVFRLSSKYRLI